MTKRELKRRSTPPRRPTSSRPDARKPKRPSRPSSGRNRPGQANNTPNWMLIGGGLAAVFILIVIGFFVSQILRNDEEDNVAATAVIATPSTSDDMLPSIANTPTDTATEMVDEATAVIPPEDTAPVFQPPDIAALQQYMQSLINADRLANGQSELGWDEAAARASMAHAQEMASVGYMSHWNLQGYGPDYRYTRAGGLSYARENVYSYEHTPNSSLTPTSAESWRELIAAAQESLMNSEGHRANILSPEHTAVGVGIAYDVENGRLRIAQVFTGRYVVIEPLPLQVALGEQVVVNGRLLATASNPLINLAYEPYPTPLGLSDLRNTGAYDSPAEIFDVVNITVNADRSFSQPVPLNHDDKPGFYHMRVWVDTVHGSTLAANIIIEVR